MSIIIVNNEKNRRLLDNIFKNAPKTFEESLKKGKLFPIPKGIKHDYYIRNFFKIETELKRIQFLKKH